LFASVFVVLIDVCEALVVSETDNVEVELVVLWVVVITGAV